MVYDIIVFEYLRFLPSIRKREAGVFKNLHSGEGLWKDAFWVTVFIRYVWAVRQSGWKKSPFSSKKGYVWTGPKFCITYVFYSSWVFQPSQDDPEDDYRTGCRNVSHCQQQSYSGLRSPGRSHSTYSSYILPYVRGRVSYCLSRRNFIFQAKGPQWPGSMVRGVNSDLQRVRQQAFWRWF